LSTHGGTACSGAIRFGPMSFPFFKMEATANDFVVVYASDLPPEAGPSLALAVCDRRRGIGADGVLVIGPPDGDRAGSMTVWNADGSVAEMCGNGLRCVALRLREDGSNPESLRLGTGAGDVDATFTDRGVRVLLGTPRPADAPRIVETDHGAIRGLDVGMGNPHFVVFAEDAPPSDLRTWGPAVATHASFPDGTNVERLGVHGGGLSMRVWERGAGETMACGSGACAAFVAARVQGRVEGHTSDVRLRGGTLRIHWPGDGPVSLEGPARTVYTGAWPTSGARG